MKKVVFVVVFALFFACKDSGKSNSQKKNETLEEISGIVDLNGEPVDMSMFIGKKVLVNFWATWCAPCKKEMPDLLEAQKILTKDNYVFLLISDESQAQILEFKKKTNYDFTFLKSTKPTSSLGIYALPTTFVYTEKGEKVDKIIGAVQWNSEKMINKLKNIK
ncbi:MAG: TlpA family protein disulfide reductase [Flavobacteriaceae bacterium]|nr:TlpA family protein disulfide reductase [Flavobacteriaceae bacterium]